MHIKSELFQSIERLKFKFFSTLITSAIETKTEAGVNSASSSINIRNIFAKPLNILAVDGTLVNRISIKCSYVSFTWLFHVRTFDENPNCKIHSFTIELLKLNNTFILVGNLKQSLVDDNDECVCVFDLH